jgi:acyl carrier protein phosphodiesterase
MNWLAHLLLSSPSPATRIGSILPDFAGPAELKGLPADFQRGIRLHHQIDAFTDSHPAVRRSVRRIEPPLRRFGGILVDVFYDHFLSVAWSSYAEQELESFVQEVYNSLEDHRGHLPGPVMEVFKKMRAADWLCSYRDIAGVRLTLERISRRLRRPVELAAGVRDLERGYEQFRDDFSVFFPELVGFVEAQGMALGAMRR